MLSKKKLKNSTKNLSATLQVKIDLLKKKLEYMNNKKSSKSSLPYVLEPSKLLLPTQIGCGKRLDYQPLKDLDMER